MQHWSAPSDSCDSHNFTENNLDELFLKKGKQRTAYLHDSLIWCLASQFSTNPCTTYVNYVEEMMQI